MMQLRCSFVRLLVWHGHAYTLVLAQLCEKNEVVHRGSTEGAFCRWDLLQVFCILYMAAVVPVRVGFDFVATGGIFYFELLIDIYFWIDLGLNFITAHTEDDLGTVCVDPARIAMQYLKGWFIIDFLAIFPMDYILLGSKVCTFAAHAHVRCVPLHTGMRNSETYNACEDVCRPQAACTWGTVQRLACRKPLT